MVVGSSPTVGVFYSYEDRDKLKSNQSSRWGPASPCSTRAWVPSVPTRTTSVGCIWWSLRLGLFLAPLWRRDRRWGLCSGLGGPVWGPFPCSCTLFVGRRWSSRGRANRAFIQRPAWPAWGSCVRWYRLELGCGSSLRGCICFWNAPWRLWVFNYFYRVYSRCESSTYGLAKNELLFPSLMGLAEIEKIRYFSC